MQKISLSLFSIVLLMASCKKEHNVNALKDQLSGTWELERTICGECFVPNTNYAPGNGNLLVFGDDGSFQRKKQDTVLFTGTFSVIISKECSSNGDQALTTNESSTGTTPQFIALNADSLVLSTPSCYQDGGSTIYKRIRK